MNIIKNSIKALFIIFIFLVFGYFQRGNILYLINNQKVKEITNYLVANEIESLLVANMKGDESETLIGGLPLDLRRNYKSIIKTTRLLSGPESRIYCSFYYREGKDLVYEVTTSRMWPSSTFYFGDIKYVYTQSVQE